MSLGIKQRLVCKTAEAYSILIHYILHRLLWLKDETKEGLYKRENIKMIQSKHLCVFLLRQRLEQEGGWMLKLKEGQMTLQYL